MPTSTTKTFLMGNVFLPQSVSDLKDINIQPNGKFRYTPIIEYDIKQFLLKRYKREKGYVKVSTLNLPIMIRSYYVSNGNSYIDRSIYMINLTFIIPEKEHEIVSLAFNGLIFFKRLDNDTKFTNLTLDNMIKNNNIPCAKPSSKINKD
ncbi:MAG: hypothetical protein KAJ49_02580 [Arcobacteraceae bacterium]|nr:hypothetical protein [Arcobacteraceae bacterium]